MEHGATEWAFHLTLCLLVKKVYTDGLFMPELFNVCLYRTCFVLMATVMLE